MSKSRLGPGQHISNKGLVVSATFEITNPGIAVSIQDFGRIGYRNIGVPLSGALDIYLLSAANTLVNNPLDSAGFEIRWSGPTLKAENKPIRVALAGDITAWLTDPQGTRTQVDSFQSVLVPPGQSLVIDSVKSGVAYAAVSGGILVPKQLKSRSSYPKARIGGHHGLALSSGDILSCQEAAAEIPTELKATKKWLNDSGDVRVILGPQEDHFAPESIDHFFSQPWTISRQTDRMGMRLEGPPIAHNEQGADIISDGVISGAIQVPANGQPIILLADCQTSGGYPKIATVISADLSKLVHKKPGDTLRFQKVNHQEAKEALNKKTELFETWKQSIQAFLPPGSIDVDALYNSNLVSGVLSGSEE